MKCKLGFEAENVKSERKTNRIIKTTVFIETVSTCCRDDPIKWMNAVASILLIPP